MIGKTISHYHIIEQLGAGGMGVVYKAEDIKLKRTVALKFLPPELTRDEEAKNRFIHEAQAASSLEHNNICNIHEIDQTEDDQLFVVMACYEGETLQEKIERGPIKIDEAVDIAIQISQGLTKAHEKGIIHRDIKPSNIFITTDGNVKIMDFGLAKLTGRTTLTKEGYTLGTVNYMSPEQAKGEKIDLRTDIWSLGMVLYEMMTGQLAFRSEYEQAVIYSILNEPPGPMTTDGREFPEQIQNVINKCLQKDPSKRYQSATELVTEFIRVARELRFEISEMQDIFDKKKKITKYLYPTVFFLVIVLLVFPPSRKLINRWFDLKPIPEEKHLAILPLNNIGDNPKNKAFCEGLVEILTSQLTQMEDFRGTLWVVPFSEIRKMGIESVKEVKTEFSANLAVTGSLQRDRNDIRLTLNLVNTKSLRQIRSAIIEEPFTNIYAIEDTLINVLTSMLEIELLSERKKIITAGSTQIPLASDFYIQGRGYLQRYEKIENIDKAIGLFNKALENDPKYALAYAGLGEAYWRKYLSKKDMQWIEDALSNCEKAVQLNARLAPVYVTLGIVNRGTGKYDEALKALKRALKINPSYSNAIMELAKVYEALGQIKDAKLMYEKAIDLKPSYWAGYNSLGIFYYKQGQYNKAIAEFKKVVELTPENTRGYNNLGGLYFLLKEWENSKIMFQRSIEINPNYHAYSNLGTLNYYDENYTESIKMYQKALELSDTDYRIWGYLADSYYWISELQDSSYSHYRQAIQLAKKQLSVNPKDYGTMVHLAGYHAQLGQKIQADSLLNILIESNPGDLEIIFRIGDIYEQLGNRDLALQWINKALSNGFSLAEIERNPGLKELRSDMRFQRIIQNLNDKRN
jgi:serine/threonine protein kinase/tetratricopeptide (TPR) repeat protein